MWCWSLFSYILVWFNFKSALADVSHLLTDQYPVTLFQQLPQPPDLLQNYQYSYQNDLETLYDAEGPALYPKPTPAPVAPTATSTTEFLLPEVIDNRKGKLAAHFIPLRSSYLPPERPQYESPKPIQPVYLPPVKNENTFIDSANAGYNYNRPTVSTSTDPIVVVDPNEQFGGYNYQSPQFPLFSTPAPIYIPPANALENDVLGDSNIGTELHFKLNKLHCLRHHEGYFRSQLKMDHLLKVIPVVDNDSYDKRCQLRQLADMIVIDIDESDFAHCGVSDCGKDLCLRLRFPTIRGMRTANDAILTLHCKSQERVAAKTYALRMAVSNGAQARSLGTHALGGSKNVLRTHVELLRKSANGFTHRLEPNEIVQLGEELLLRAHVLAGDAWNYTKLTDVSLQRISRNGEPINSIQLINAEGCVNPSMKSVCQQAPWFDAPLGQKLAFKAVMFQGMHSGDELVMSMRITGCLEAQDCQLQTQHCNFVGSSLGRRKRNTSLPKQTFNQTYDNKASEAASEISRISFRVAFEKSELNENINDLNDSRSERQAERSLVLVGSLGFVVLLICLGIFIILKLK